MLTQIFIVFFYSTAGVLFLLKNPTLSLLWLYSLGAVWILLMVVNPNITEDLLQYERYYYAVAEYHDLLNPNVVWKGDYVYYLISGFFSTNGFLFSEFLIFIQSITIISFIFLIHKSANLINMKRKPMFIVMCGLSFLLNPYVHFSLHNIIRQSLATIAVLWCIYFLLSNQNFKRFVAIVISPFLHKSAILPIIALFAKKSYISSLYGVFLFVLFVFGAYFISMQFDVNFFRKVDKYIAVSEFGSGKEHRSLYVYLFYVIFFTSLGLFTMRQKFANNLQVMLRFFFFYSVGLLGILLVSETLFYRFFASYFIVFAYIFSFLAVMRVEMSYFVYVCLVFYLPFFINHPSLLIFWR